MPTKRTSSIPEEILELYTRLVASNPMVKMQGVTVPHTSHNGYVFSYLEKNGSMGLRLPEKEREAFLKKYKTSIFLSYDKMKKGFVAVPERLLRNANELKLYFDISFKYVNTLKPKTK
jgi:hypothetical protein